MSSRNFTPFRISINIVSVRRHVYVYIQSASVPQSVIQERLWRRDAALRTVSTTDRQPSEASVPTAACLAAYLFPRP
jgi:hypothetical protein